MQTCVRVQLQYAFTSVHEYSNNNSETAVQAVNKLEITTQLTGYTYTYNFVYIYVATYTVH